MNETRREALHERLRHNVLKALDETALEFSGRKDQGWKDSELPDLFRALDVNEQKIADRIDAIEAQRHEPVAGAYEVAP